MGDNKVNKKQRAKQNAAKKENKQMRLVKSASTFVLGLMLLSGMAVFASKGGKQLLSFLSPSVKVTLSGTVSRDGGKIDLGKAGLVKSGEILDWKIVSENDGDGAAENYAAIGQIPAGTEFVAGSANAEGKATVKYSIDRGKTFSVKPMIKKKQASGAVKRVAAPASMYTQVQFVWEKSLDSGKKLNATYKVRVK